VRRALVTGASSGIGASIARRLIADGWTVRAVARREAVLRAELPEAEAFPADVTDPEAMRAAIPAEGLDLLVSAAGANLPERRLHQLTPESWDRMVAVNLTGTFHPLSAALPALRASRGLAILVSSVSAAWPDVSGPAYQAAKAGVLALGRAAALEERDAGVRVSVVMPGAVDTPLLENRPKPPTAQERARMLQPDDVAEICSLLAALPPRAYVPEVTVLPTGTQALGATS
jgi:NAD(P)-dependent dehydrogenase (short-subunit alcohol dehydrogenase family)